MTYDPRPKPSGDTLVSSRNPIRTNFEIIKNRFEDNHAAYGSGTGHHTRLDLNEQTTFPATAANESWMASREFNTRTELAWRPESQGAAADMFFLSAMPIRASGFFIDNGNDAGQTLLGRSFNVSSVVRSTTGSAPNFRRRYAVTFLTALRAGLTNYFAFATSQSSNGNNKDPLAINYSEPNTVSKFTLVDEQRTSTTDRVIYFVVFGG